MKASAERIAGTLALALVPGIAIGLSLLALWYQAGASAPERIAPLATDPLPLVILIGLAAMVCAGAIAWKLTGRYADACLQIGDAIEPVLAGAGSELPDFVGGAEIQHLRGRIGRLMVALTEARSEMAAHAAQARESMERERNQLAALVAELPQSVIACNREGRILLYNTHARILFGGGRDGVVDPGRVGLGRPLEGLFDRRLLAHTRERIHDRLAAGRDRILVSFVTATAAGRLVRVRVMPVLGADPDSAPLERLSGYLLIAEDVTRESEQAARRDRLVELLTQSQRAGLAGIRAAAENLAAFDDIEPAQRDRFLKLIREDAARLSDRISNTAREFSDVLRTHTALEPMHGVDLISAAQRRIEARTGLLTKLESVDALLWLRVDSFALIQVLTVLAQRIQDACDVREVRLALLGEDALARIELSWSGTGLSNETALGWEMEPMRLAGESSERSIREVLARHDGQLVYSRVRATARSNFCVLLPRADPAEDEVGQGADDGARPEFYDFDLFAWGARRDAIDQRPLTELSYTVFDTETTGLDPSGGDEIIQFGALRIVNGRLLRGERFEQLVDPRREINPAAEAVHGISRERLRGQPDILQVLPAFHAYAHDTVLVGHNAAFDMRFLQIKEAQTGLRFDQPVLDTLLLSAVLHPNQETHRLEAIAERFGVPVLDRHDASGDARVTAQLFLRMIPLLAERGIVTLGQAREASEKTYYARVRY